MQSFAADFKSDDYVKKMEKEKSDASVIKMKTWIQEFRA